MKKLVIIPAYNEEQCIEKTVRDLQQNAPDYDYIVINDCSSDNTAKLCRSQGYPLLDLPDNLGIGGAVQTGYRYARAAGYDIAVQFDGDGQHNASYLKDMEQKLLATRCDMVIGSRFITHHGFQSTALRQFGIRFFTGLIRFLTGKEITDPTSGMRMVNRQLIEEFARKYPGDYPEPESVTAVLHKGYKVEEVPVQMNERYGGTSSISPKRAVYYMVKVTLAVLLARFSR